MLAEFSTSPIRQSSPLRPQLASSTPPSVMPQQHLPPYPHPSRSVPYTASRRPPLMSSSPAANNVNRNYTPPDQALLSTPPQQGHYGLCAPPKHHHHQPMTYGSSMPPGYLLPLPGVPASANYMQQQQQQREYLFPPPTYKQYEVPVQRSKHNSSFISQQLEDITVYNPAPPTTTTATTKTTAAEDIANIDWNELTSDTTTSKSRREKTRHRAAKFTKQTTSTSAPSVAESSQVIKGVSTRRVGKGRARSSRDTSTAQGSSKQKHQQR